MLATGPYVLISGLCLVLLVFFQKSVLLPVVSVNVKLGSSWELLCCTLGFIICLLGLFQWVSPLAVAATIFLFLLFANRCLLAGIDYSLLATFFFFLFLLKYRKCNLFQELSFFRSCRSCVAGGSAGKPGYQQCTCGIAAVRIHYSMGCFDRRM